MSSAANHAERSHRSHAAHRSAMSGMARRNLIRNTADRSGTGSLISRLRAFTRRISEARNSGN